MGYCFHHDGYYDKLMRILFLLLALTLAAPLQAARSYAIDMLIFQRASPGSGERYWPDSQAAPISLNNNTEATPLHGGPLSGVAAKLDRQPGYRVLYHRFWRQPVFSRRGSSPITIHVDRGGDARVDGSVSISARHYLHLDVDLTLRHDGIPVAFKAHQRMRSGETYYIDHPLGGIIIRALSPKR